MNVSRPDEDSSYTMASDSLILLVDTAEELRVGRDVLEIDFTKVNIVNSSIDAEFEVRFLSCN